MPAPGLDLMRFAPIRGLLRAVWFPYVLQLATLTVFVWLAFRGWGLVAPEGVPSKQYAKVCLVTLLIWGLWWPAMVWVAFWFGRAWCAVCPMELVSNISERIARLVRLPQRRLPRWIAGGSLIVLFYLAIQLLVAGVHLHRVPAWTSIFLLVLLGLAVLTGLLFRDRAFCRGFCPVGLLLNVYGRGGMLAVRPRAKEPCGNCQRHECLRGDCRNALDARSCPSLLNPSRLSTNADCLLCGQCLKACGNENMTLALRRPFAAGDEREPLASWPVTLFVMILSGFVTYEVFSEWKAAKAVFLEPVKRFGTWIDAGAGAAGRLQGAYVLLVVPAVLWLLLGGLVRLLGGAGGLGDAWRRLALPMAVVLAAGHLAKGLAKLTSWGGYLPGAIEDPAGVRTAQQLVVGEIVKPGPLLSLPVVALVGCALLIGSIAWGIREARLADFGGYRRRVAPIALVGVFFLSLVAGWALQ